MPQGGRMRRTARGSALIATMVLTGCHWLPVRQVDPALYPHQGAVAEPVTDASDPKSTLPPLVAVADSEIHSPLPPTPLMDAALARAEMLNRSITEEVAGPAPEPIPVQVRPTAAVAQISAPSPYPSPSPYLVPFPPSEPAPPAEPRAEEARAAAPVVTEPTPPPQEPVPVEEPPTPEEAWREGLEQLRDLAHDRARQPGVDTEAEAWRLRERLLDWMREEPVTGVQPTDDEGPAWETVLSVLAAATTEEDRPDFGPPSAEAIRSAARALEEEAPLEIVDTRFCRKVDGFGRFEPLDAGSLKAGKEVILYCEVAWLRYEPIAGRFRSRLAARVEIIPEGGTAPAWEHNLGTAEDTCHRRRSDYFVNYVLTLPPSLAPGPYQLRLIQDDLISRHSASRSIPLTIQP